ncbi:MAG: ParB/RepB/Spo0J family partition protein [Bacteroidales bacterium]|nr:ParB/RepB/Spo0J family partition protein [Bacteroidales bacterium]
MTAKRPALGRGLAALMGEDTPDTKEQIGHGRHDAPSPLLEAEEGVIGAIAAIPVDSIDANPFQPRRQFNDETLDELCQSIKTNGLITPITVRKTGKRYQLISGERRLRASKLAGLKEVPAYIRMANDNESLEMALIENIQREDLNAIDVALSYQALMDAYKYNQEELSRRVGKSRSAVANFLRLLKLPADIQLYLKDNKISMGHARCIAGVEKQEEQLALAQAVIEKDLSVRELEMLAHRIGKREEKEDRKPTAHTLPQWEEKAIGKLSAKLHTPVNIKHGKGGKGHIVIEYASEEELQTIFKLLDE